MAYRVGVDAGGTFTDLIIHDGEGNIVIAKSPSTPERPTIAILDTLRLAAEQYKVSLKELLSSCELFVHATTVATNAVIEGKRAKVGLICTEGFKHVLYMRDGGRTDIYNLHVDYPEPLVPLYLTLPVRERINAEGKIEVPLDEKSLIQTIRQLKKWNVGAIAVCLLWSIVNPIHEKRIGEIIRQEWPDVDYSLSHEVAPVIREYQRTCATVLDASLKPIVKDYIQGLERSLKTNGLRQDFVMAISSGGMMPASEVIKKPVHTIASGPAMGPVVGKICGEEAGTGNVIVADMGGTSCDVSMIIDGAITLTRTKTIGADAAGITMTEVSSIGAGGGSIGWVDAASLLHVGPASAGAEPGPACYGKGGRDATVTDADLLLGYLNKDNFLGGRLSLCPELSHEAIEEKVAKPLGLEVDRAACAVFDVVNENMANCVEEISVRRGLDPREFLLVFFGGAGPVHAAAIASSLNMTKVYIPRLAAGACALGMLLTDIKFQNIATHFTNSNEFDFEGVNRVLAELESKGRASLEKERVAPEDMKFEHFVDARYPLQVWGLEIPLSRRKVTPDMMSDIVESFHRAHEQKYGVREEGQHVEFNDWSVVATGIVPRIMLREQKHAGEDASSAIKGKRKAYFKEERGFVETPIYDGSKLAYGNRISGPAIIEEVTTTVVAPPGSKVSVNRWGDYLMDLTPR
ncbi:MAG: hydantoinase/oxoprolinase family protein [Chloroflexi bacterium]|nr:hydantoinase/oxoprolinase family protein [Chloroflexota bacterium]